MMPALLGKIMFVILTLFGMTECWVEQNPVVKETIITETVLFQAQVGPRSAKLSGDGQDVRFNLPIYGVHSATTLRATFWLPNDAQPLVGVTGGDIKELQLGEGQNSVVVIDSRLLQALKKGWADIHADILAYKEPTKEGAIPTAWTFLASDEEKKYYWLKTGQGGEGAVRLWIRLVAKPPDVCLAILGVTKDCPLAVTLKNENPKPGFYVLVSGYSGFSQVVCQQTGTGETFLGNGWSERVGNSAVATYFVPAATDAKTPSCQVGDGVYEWEIKVQLGTGKYTKSLRTGNATAFGVIAIRGRQ